MKLRNIVSDASSTDGTKSFLEDVQPPTVPMRGDPAMRILVAPSGFKESLGPEEVAQCIERGLRKVIDASTALIHQLPLHDGGEGFCRALVAAQNGEIIGCTVTGPVRNSVSSHIGLIRKGQEVTAVIDMAAAAGLRLVPKDCRDPTTTTTYGVGELIAAALDEGCNKIIIGCGDSGTSDAGAGMLQALGVQMLDALGDELPLADGGRSLSRLASIDLDNLHPRLRDETDQIEIEAVCNCKNVLCGTKGVARVYGPQKGATPAQVESLSLALENYAAVAKKVLGRDISQEPGSGASGGLGAGLMLLGGKLRPRGEAINDYFEFEAVLEEHWDFIVTAEGSLDSQSTQGKMTTEIARRARERGARVVALAGTIGTGADLCYEAGIEAFTSIMEGPMTLEDAMRDTAKLLEEGAEKIMRMIMVGVSLVISPCPPRKESVKELGSRQLSGESAPIIKKVLRS